MKVYTLYHKKLTPYSESVKNNLHQNINIEIPGNCNTNKKCELQEIDYLKVSKK